MRSNALFLACVVAASALAAPAAAQGGGDDAPLALHLVAGAVGAPLDPLGAPAEVPITVQATCPDAGNRTADIALNLTVVEAPPWLNASLRPGNVTITDACTGSARPANATLVLRALPGAPAFEQEAVRLRAEAVDRAAAAEASTAAVVGFLGRMDVSPKRVDVTAKPQQSLDVPLTITNRGNAPITVTLSREDGGRHGAFQVVLPGAITVGPPGGGDNRREVIVSIQAPYENGYVDEQGAIVLDVVSHYALNQSLRGEAASAAIVVATSGFHAPGPAAAFTLALMAAAGLAARGLAARRGGE